MRKALLLTLIITVLPSLALPKEPAKVPFIEIWGHEKDTTTVLYFNYDTLYRENEYISRNLTMCGGYNYKGQQIEQWLIGTIGYYMLKHNAWFVYVLDSNTPETGKYVNDTIANKRQIDITQELLDNWGKIDANQYMTLKSGRNLYYLPMYVNDWPLHLLCDR